MWSNKNTCHVFNSLPFLLFFFLPALLASTFASEKFEIQLSFSLFFVGVLDCDLRDHLAFFEHVARQRKLPRWIIKRRSELREFPVISWRNGSSNKKKKNARKFHRIREKHVFLAAKKILRAIFFLFFLRWIRNYDARKFLGRGRKQKGEGGIRGGNGKKNWRASLPVIGQRRLVVPRKSRCKCGHSRN